MRLSKSFFWDNKVRLLSAGVLLLTLSLLLTANAMAQSTTTAGTRGRLVTIYDRGVQKVILTHAHTVSGAIKDAGVPLAPEDTVEPKLDTKLVTTDYSVNVYRARPMIIVDGMTRQKIMTAAQTPDDIMATAQIPALHDEDMTTLTASRDIVSEGASTVMTIVRATEFTLQLYGQPTVVYTHAATVGEMIAHKGIKLTSSDSLSVKPTEPVVKGMTVAIWRNGVQTATVEEPIPFTSRQVIDVDRPIGYRAVQVAGSNGRKSVTYQITAQNGRELQRSAIQSVVLEQPKEQIEVVGAKPGNGLTKSKGAQQFTDSRGVTHRETYYDLPMNIVMRACGGGEYTIRVDGAKVDKDGYILVAANLQNYPKCSVVETSMGPGKVYDTGGFAARHPHGFDLATDWTNNNGR